MRFADLLLLSMISDKAIPPCASGLLIVYGVIYNYEIYQIRYIISFLVS